MKRVLLDCSVTIAWFFEDEVSEYSEGMLEAISKQRVKAVVPALWELEVANVFLSKIRRNFISFSQATESLSRLRDLDIEIQLPILSQNFEIFFPLAHQEGLTSYDANYLHLAISESIPLASLDAKLCSAAKSVGVKIFKL
jgi:predicted nucleic acid-binding protein